MVRMTGFPGEAPATRPLASPGPFLVIAAIGLIATGGLVWSLFRDPGIPAVVAADYMDVAGGLVHPAHHTSDPDALSAALAQELAGSPVTVPDLTRAGYRLDGGRVHAVGDRPGVLAIYHSDRRDLLIYHGWRGSTDALPPADDTREYPDRTYVVYQKSSTTLVFWQDGDVVRVLTAGLPTEHVVKAALSLAPSRADAANP